MTPDDARRVLSDEIREVGPIPFERYMDLALYGDAGFYVRPGGGVAGRRGDFLTSPEVGPLFGAVIARHVDAEWERLGRPDPYVVVDAGAGPGTLARSIHSARPRCVDAMQYVAVEVSPAQRERHPPHVESVAAMPRGPFTGIVLANELLDNLPFRLAVYDGGWREAYVDLGPDGRFVERLSQPFDPPVPQLPEHAPHGARVPLVERAASFVEATLSSMSAGSLLVIDYGVANTSELAARRWREWLRTYRGNETGDHYLVDPGGQDITTDIPLDQLATADLVRTQAQFLQRWGIDDLVEEGRRIWSEQAGRPGLEAMRMRSRISEAEALLDSSGLGGFLVVQWTVPDATPAAGTPA